MKIINLFYLIITFFNLIININTNRTNIRYKNKNKNKDDSYLDEDEYGNELSSLSNALDLAINLYPKKDKKKSEKYLKERKLKDSEVTPHIANLMKDNKDSKKSFIKLNEFMDLFVDGKAILKRNPQLKKTLGLIVKDQKMKMETRVYASKLATKLYDIPVTIQYTQPDTSKSPVDYSTIVTVPRIQRLYRPDYYAENIKAGNWAI
jgi:hypothetical protein